VPATATLTSPDDRWQLPPVDGPAAVDVWRDSQARSFLPFEARAETPADARFHARVERRAVGPLSIVDYECGCARGRRGPRQIADTDGDLIGFLTLRRGRMGLELDGGTMLAHAGDAVVWDSGAEGGFTAVTPIAKRTLVVPRDLLRATLPGFERALSRPLRADGPLALLRQFIDTLFELAGALQGAGQAAAVDGALALARGALTAQVPAPTDLRTTLILQVPRFVDAHLADPHLSPSMIARAHAVSTRTLYEAFQDTGETPAALIRRRRLERCHAELSEPGHASVTEVALRWGFNDSSHFSRAFRQHFGLTPRDVRASAHG
jgi:AraC-like DNA-binding protein